MTVMIDSSVWIGYFNGIISWEADMFCPLFYADRDFDPMVKHLGLRSYQ